MLLECQEQRKHGYTGRINSDLDESIAIGKVSRSKRFKKVVPSQVITSLATMSN